jgi:TRAP-type C4-dicarboxylate transport system permease large subunit
LKWRAKLGQSDCAVLIAHFALTPVQVLIAVIVLYLVLGTFMEELSMMISTIPITTPLLVQAGYDSVWYGILIILLIQTVMISPPFGTIYWSFTAFVAGARCQTSRRVSRRL